LAGLLEIGAEARNCVEEGLVHGAPCHDDGVPKISEGAVDEGFGFADQPFELRYVNSDPIGDPADPADKAALPFAGFVRVFEDVYCVEDVVEIGLAVSAGRRSG
jgi:hypothetical protein